MCYNAIAICINLSVTKHKQRFSVWL